MKEGKVRSNVKKPNADGKRPVKGPEPGSVRSVKQIAKDNEKLHAAPDGNMERALLHLYINCPVSVTSTLKRNPQMLGDDDEGWLRSDTVFRILAAYGFDEDYLEGLYDKYGFNEVDG